MKLHRIALRNYRGVVDTQVDFPATGVTIVRGDNEVGKTSLAEAVDLLLTYPDSSSAKRVKSVQAVGRDDGAEVEVELSTGPYRLVYRKRWHRQRQTTLEILEPRHEQLSGKEAHDRVDAILRETLDHDLWRALTLTQGTELTQPGFDVTSLGSSLDAAAGGDLATDREGDLWERICAEYDRYWTAHGHARVDRVNAAEALRTADEQRDRIVAELRALDDATEEVERLTAAAAELERSASDNGRAVAELMTQAAAVSDCRRDVRHLTAERDVARTARDRAADLWERRVELLAEVERRAEEVAKRQAEAHSSELARATSQHRHERAQERLAHTRTAYSEAEEALRRSVADQDHRRREIEHAQLTERHDRVVAAQARLTEAERLLDGAPVDEGVVRSIEEAHLAVVTADAVAASAAARVHIEAFQPLVVEVDGRPTTVHPGLDESLTVGGRLSLELPGVARLTLHAGDEARALAERVASARAVLEQRCRAVGVADLEEARARAGEREDALRDATDARDTIARDLRDLTLETVAQKIRRLGERVAEYAAARAPEPPLPPDLEVAQDVAARAATALDARRAELADAEADAEQASAALQRAQVDDAGLRAVIDHAVAAAEQSRRSLAAARAEITDEAIRDQLRDADALQETAEAALARAQAILAAAEPETTELLLGNARATADRLAEDVRRNAERRQELRVLLDLKGEQGLAQHLDEATTRLEHLQREHDRLEARALAAQLLRDTFARHRDAARRRYVAPFRDRIEQLGRIVYGPDLQIELDDDLRIARRTLGGITLDVDQLSVGAREQLGILSRLACATLVSTDDGAPVIFDDALGWTDPARLERMAAAISVAGRDCQVIVLTCTPGRYAAVGGAHIVELSR